MTDCHAHGMACLRRLDRDTWLPPTTPAATTLPQPTTTTAHHHRSPPLPPPLSPAAGPDAGAASLFLDAKLSQPTDAAADVHSLGLENGAMLFTPAAKKPAVKAGKDAFAAREKAGLAHSEAKKALGDGKVKDWKELTKEQGELRVKRQEKAVCSRLSMDQTTSLQLAAYLQNRAGGEAGEGHKRRVALLFGTVEVDSKGETQVNVEALWEPPQPKATAKHCDTASLRKAVKGSPALKVAQGLGLRVVGWLFSHDPRGHFLSDRDVLLTAQLRRQIDLDHGKNASASLVVVAARTDGGEAGGEAAEKSKAKAKGKGKGKKSKAAQVSVSFEAYQISEQVYIKGYIVRCKFFNNHRSLHEWVFVLSPPTHPSSLHLSVRHV